MHIVIMGLIKKLLAKQTLKRIGLGILDSVPVLATVKQNVESQHPTEGKFDWLRFTITVLTVGVLVGVITGKLTVEQAMQLINMFK